MIAYSNFSTIPDSQGIEGSCGAWERVNFLVLAEENPPKTYKMMVQHHRIWRCENTRARKVPSYLPPIEVPWPCLLVLLQAVFKGKSDIVHVHKCEFSRLRWNLAALIREKNNFGYHDSVPETYAGKFGTILRFCTDCCAWKNRFCCGFANKLICVNDIQKENYWPEDFRRRYPYCSMSLPQNFKYENKRQIIIKKRFDLVFHEPSTKILGII